MIRRAHAALVDMDPLVLLLRSSLLALVVNSNDDAPVLLGVAVVCVVALPRPDLLRRPWLWAALFVAIGTRQLATWHQIDDHIIVTTYWCGAIALGLTAREPRRTLAAAARLLVGGVFAFAAAWKLGSGEFADGSFFRYSLLFDDRFATVARVVGGTTRSMHDANIDAFNDLARDPGRGWLQLQEGPRNVALAQLFTWWGITIESAVAIAHLTPLRRGWEAIRPVTLLAFAGTTYLVVPVGGFGTVLLVLGAAQASSDRLRVAYTWGALGLLAWAGIWPLLFR
jgi:hypothetical protein